MIKIIIPTIDEYAKIFLAVGVKRYEPTKIVMIENIMKTAHTKYTISFRQWRMMRYTMIKDRQTTGHTIIMIFLASKTL